MGYILQTTHHAFTLLLITVSLSAWYFGTSSGILALCLSCLASPSYVRVWGQSFFYDAGEFILAGSLILYFNQERLRCDLTLQREREEFHRLKAEAFADAVGLIGIELGDVLTTLVSYAEIALPEDSKELDEIRAAGARGARRLAELQLMAKSKKNESP